MKRTITIAFISLVFCKCNRNEKQIEQTSKSEFIKEYSNCGWEELIKEIELNERLAKDVFYNRDLVTLKKQTFYGR